MEVGLRAPDVKYGNGFYSSVVVRGGGGERGIQYVIVCLILSEKMHLDQFYILTALKISELMFFMRVTVMNR